MDKTNTEIMNTPSGVPLSGLDGQRRYVLRQLSTPKPCPNCGAELSFFWAANIKIDDLDLIHTNADHPCSCPMCRSTLIYTQPFVGDWHWRLEPIKQGEIK